MKRAVHFILKKLGLLSLYSLRRSGYLLDKGWFQSFRAKASVDRSGRPIPWMTYAFLDFLEPRLRGNFNVFEFGSGNSTHWWAARVRAVSSCEHDAEWFARVSEGVPPNATVLHRSVTNQAYRSVLREDDHVGQSYDVIVIDGVDRVGCALNCLESLRPDGVVIWDNSDRSDYEEGYEFLLGRASGGSTSTAWGRSTSWPGAHRSFTARRTAWGYEGRRRLRMSHQPMSIP